MLSFFCPPSSPFSQHSILRLLPLVFTFTIPSIIFLFLFVGICATTSSTLQSQSRRKSSSLYFFSLIYAVWSLPPVAALLDSLFHKLGSLFRAKNPFRVFPKHMQHHITYLHCPRAGPGPHQQNMLLLVGTCGLLEQLGSNPSRFQEALKDCTSSSPPTCTVLVQYLYK